MSKVKIGAKYPRFAPIVAEPASALPTYGAEKVTIGEMIKSDLTINLASGEIFSDDALNIKLAEFASGTVAMETDGIDDEVAGALFGATVDEGLVTYNVGDAAPNGGLGYYAMMKDKSAGTYYKAYYFPKVQAAMGNDNSATKSGSISFQTANTTFTVMKCNNGDWMQTETLATEAEAVEWIEKKLTTPTTPSTPDPV